MFDPKRELPTYPPNSFGKWGDLSFIPNNQKMGQNYKNNWNSSSGGDGVHFRLETKEEDSGICSPPLWRNSPPRSYENQSQTPQNLSRKQAIAKGQHELMEMVKNMPESSYELSLKDIVDHKYNQNGFGHEQEDFSANTNEEKAILGGNNKKQKKGNKVLRSTSKNNEHNRGMLLKMGSLPFCFLGSKKKKSSVTNKNNNTCAKVSPKPEVYEKSISLGKNVEKDWWRKKLTVSGDSESGGGSSRGGSTTSSSGSRGSSDGSRRSNSNSNSSRRNTSQSTSGCWPIFRFKNNKHAT